jgi:uncharacterized membrane protein YhaH (DUF805 family)
LTGRSSEFWKDLVTAMTRRSRVWALLFIGAAIVALIFLAAAFRNLELSSQGRPLPSPAQMEPGPTVAPPTAPFLVYAYLALFFLGLVLMPILFVLAMRSPHARKELLKRILALAWIITILLVARMCSDESEQIDEEPIRAQPTAEAAPLALEDAPPLRPEAIGEPPLWAVWAATLALGILLAGGLVAGVWIIWRRLHPPTPLEQLAQEAQHALDSLLDGADLRDTVMRCYLAMSRTLKRHKGIRRDEDMTPREFERSLAETGLPGEQVHQLTRLFEAARYGARAPSAGDARQAIHCLTAIVEACRSAP